MKRISSGLLIIALFLTPSLFSQISSPQIDSLTERVLKTFDVPGIAVAVVKDGKLVHAKGYGVRSLNTMKKVDENTLFGVASNSKAFTAAALGMLVDEKKISWDDKVVDYVPGFKLYSPYVTMEFTIRDLLTHRSGMGLGAGDLMMFPDSSNFTREDIIHNLRYLKQVAGFRTHYDYDNNLYIVAGEIVAKVSGMSWEDFIDSRILKPLGMNATAPSMLRLKDRSNLIDPHAPVNGKVQALKIDWSETANAAGGIVTNVTDYGYNQRGNAFHLFFTEAARRYRRGAHSDAAGCFRGPGVEGNGIAVDHDAGHLQRFFRLSAGDPRLGQVNQNHVVISAAGDQAQS